MVLVVDIVVLFVYFVVYCFVLFFVVVDLWECVGGVYGDVGVFGVFLGLYNLLVGVVVLWVGLWDWLLWG